jgi:hypothetical protein
VVDAAVLESGVVIISGATGVTSSNSILDRSISRLKGSSLEAGESLETGKTGEIVESVAMGTLEFVEFDQKFDDSRGD